MGGFRSSVRNGFLTGVIGIFVVLLGLTGLAGEIVADWVGISSRAPGAWALLLALGLWVGAKTFRANQGGQVLKAGLPAGVVYALLLSAFVWAMSSLLQAGADVRKSLVQIHDQSMGLLTLGLKPAGAAALIFTTMAISGIAGAYLSSRSSRNDWRGKWAREWQSARDRTMTVPWIQRFTSRDDSRKILIRCAVLVLLISPFGLGQYWNYTFGTVGIYIVLGLGLNIVVGMAGLLNLGYAAFFAIGAYAVAILTAPQYGIMWSFWAASVVGIVMATLTGVLLSLPVLRMRGDYLAIVTLGFGEIVRILAKSDALTSFTGGPRGIRSVGGPSLFGIDLNSELYFMYLILLSIVLAVVVISRLQNSRVGRAWVAMREDEDVARAMGIYTLKYKVQAFAISAAFAGLGGVIFASRNKFTGPDDFTLLVSVNVLCLVIIGGLNSIPGVVAGALVLKALPEMLRQLSAYRMLAFGALLVIMMIVRPEGLWPSTRGKGKAGGQDEPPDAPTRASALQEREP